MNKLFCDGCDRQIRGKYQQTPDVFIQHFCEQCLESYEEYIQSEYTPTLAAALEEVNNRMRNAARRFFDARRVDTARPKAPLKKVESRKAG